MQMEPAIALARMSEPEAAGRTLMSASRNMWLTGMLAQITAHFGISAPQFISEVEGPVRTDSKGERWATYLLDTTMLRQALDGIARLLALAAERAEEYADLIGFGCTAEEIAEALDEASAEFDPVQGPSGEEEGDGPLYLFSYLKSLDTVLQDALAQGLCVIHTRHLY